LVEEDEVLGFLYEDGDFRPFNKNPSYGIYLYSNEPLSEPEGLTC